MKKIYLLSAVALLSLTACNDFEDQFHIGDQITDVKKDLPIVLEDGDYTAIAPTLAAEAEGEAAFYDLHGRRVNPETMGQGVYVKRQGQKAQKIIVK